MIEIDLKLVLRVMNLGDLGESWRLGGTFSRGEGFRDDLKLFDLIECVDDLARLIRTKLHRLASQGVARDL